MLYPLKFQPIFKERIWGGRNLERLYHKSLPAGLLIGESWEITDRPEGISVIVNGALAGRTLRWLMENKAEELLGSAKAPNGRFPLLVKILDAQDILSLQVHPPARVAGSLGGEPKTEMWYIADTSPEAELFVGIKRGVTRPEFERRIRDGTVAGCFHRLSVSPGDAMFLPSGRVHAIGAGNVIFEIQQNSDTTYRVFDWNRLDAEGKPRQLHIAEALESIDFNDYEPGLIASKLFGQGAQSRALVADSLFRVEEQHLPPGTIVETKPDRATVLGVLSGQLWVGEPDHPTSLAAGEFCLVPACLGRCPLRAETEARFLQTEPGNQNQADVADPE